MTALAIVGIVCAAMLGLALLLVPFWIFGKLSEIARQNEVLLKKIDNMNNNNVKFFEIVCKNKNWH